MADEPWTKEEFEDHWCRWAAQAGDGSIPGLGVAIPCECDQPGCHGWRMKLLGWISQPRLFDQDGVLVAEFANPDLLGPGEHLTVTQTFTV